MDYSPPPLFNQGVSARARLLFFACLAVALIIIDARAQLLETIRVGVGVVLYPLQRALLVPRDLALQVGEFFTTVSALRRENERLRRAALEQAHLLQQAQALAAENERLRKLLAARERLRTSGIVAQALYESRDRFSRKLVLDAGSQAGVQPGSPVIDELGVVGQVTRVFPLTAEVTLITDKEQAIPVQILRNGLRGVAFGGNEPGTLDLRFMAANADVVNGDVAVTSGIDGVYPPGLPVATVTRVERTAKDQFARIVLVPVAGVHNYTMLLVLNVERQLPPPPAPERRREPDKRGQAVRK
ncbi:MAG: rod shape-determining protein MreC [Sutterellaceae bacterium]|nr:rod shape-determining protein MreC [Burkholderiaceae bacterium]MCX7902638.1 rod shape-determining protein MreC [Burkholderiaceae bacterium]MDW8430152.1 rod shape-determining protein MreC [Sutterellaceae bacterium]